MVSCCFSGDGTGPGKRAADSQERSVTQPRAGCYWDSSHRICQSAKEMCVRRLVIFVPFQVFHLWEELTWLGFALSHILLRAVALDLWRLDYPCFPKALSGSPWGQTCSAGDPPALSQGCAEPRWAPRWWQQHHGDPAALQTTPHPPHLTGPPSRPL